MAMCPIIFLGKSISLANKDYATSSDITNWSECIGERCMWYHKVPDLCAIKFLACGTARLTDPDFAGAVKDNPRNIKGEY